jgi:AraC-like DNA-binding protein/ligand-binding sensor domain-containing protein
MKPIVRHHILIITLFLLLTPSCLAQQIRLQDLPYQEQLSSAKVLHIIEDDEGFLWYATEGGGICRQDGRQTDIFRSHPEQPDLLGSNNVSCLAEVNGYLVIGTFHGAYLLDKKNYSIRRIQEVDDKRIDAICKTHDGHYWLTSNRKVYEFSNHHQLLHTYPSLWKGEKKYVSDIFEDSHHQLWIAQWSGGLLRFNSRQKQFEEEEWPLEVAPSSIVEDNIHHCLWIGTISQGIIKYDLNTSKVTLQPQEFPQKTTPQTFICIDLQFDAKRQRLWMTSTEDLLLFDTSSGTLNQLSIANILPSGIKALNRISFDKRGNLLVAGSQPGPFVLSCSEDNPYFYTAIADGQYLWTYQERRGIVVRNLLNGEEKVVNNVSTPFLPILEKRKDASGIWATDGNNLIYCTIDSTQIVTALPYRAETIADDGKGYIWLGTGKGLLRINLQTKDVETVNPHANDISAITFTPDGQLWLADIYGQLFQYKNNQLVKDKYGTNEYGDAVTKLSVDSLGRLVIVSERYIRFYDTHKHTLTQQSLSAGDIYSICLNETKPFSKWSAPQRDIIVERLPLWLNSWWMWCIYVLALICLIAFIFHYHQLRKQRHLFMNSVKKGIEENRQEVETLQETAISKADKEWLQKAIVIVEQNINNESYTIEQLSNDMYMSRMTFYRKIQSLTGQKPTEFVRTIRLTRAATLLKEGKMTIKEISFATGFSSVSYFSRCFRTMFGVPPTQFGKTTIADSLDPNDTPS